MRNNRFNRRDANRTLDDDEELWFEQEDDIAENEDIMPMSDMLKTDMLKSSKIDEFDAFSMKYESKKGKGSCFIICRYVICRAKMQIALVSTVLL